ncbi:MAG: thiolase family protein [Proteobacteria bacterium]|nr:thiolase family protein [Desulfobacteraceae bacterium]MBU4315772.1 thiolase family protein [Pseudomonadota bacterium]MBU4471630.1 thiolase family protein [Pseudomonadota bacterium]MCG2751111.1 thiolase family protein [Desulfobacteraceae bacterium]
MDSNEVIIASAVRSAIGTFGGQFREMRNVPLGVPVMKAAIDRAGIDPAVIDDVGWGCCYQRAENEVNVARVTAIKAGVPVEVPAYTVMRVCTSSMWSIAQGMMAIRQGYNSVFLTGGVESMSTVPYTLDAMRWGARMNHVEVRDMMWDGVTAIGVGPAMGMTAENLAEKYNISREEQDQLAYESNMKAVAAINEGRFKEEIIPVEVPGRRGKTVLVDTDEHPRADVTLEKLSKLQPSFKKGGTVTAGNSSGINDGAAAAVIMRKAKADELGVTPLARIVDFSVVGVDPDIMGWGPVPATEQLLKKTGLKLSDIGLIEINEAFAAQYLACEKGLNLTHRRDTINVNGSGISLGHPVGATGTRMVTTLLHEMRRRNVQYGLATLCGGTGMGMAMIIELC